MTENDLRVLKATAAAPSMGWDGLAPHGLRDWTAIRRLESAGLVAYAGHGICEDCDTAAHRREPTEVALYRITDAGMVAVRKAGEHG